jgi:hypothetical protein
MIVTPQCVRESKAMIGQKALKRQQAMEKLKMNFETELAISEKLISQLTERFWFMEYAVGEIQSAIRIQVAFRGHSARCLLFRLKMIRYLSVWFIRILRIKRRRKALNRLLTFFYAYQRRLKKIKLMEKIFAAFRIYNNVSLYHTKKKILSNINVLRTFHLSEIAVMNEAKKRADAALVIRTNELILAAKKLSKMIWLVYIDYKRKKM